MAYRQNLDRFALQSVNKMPNIPDYHLMVGSAEDLGSLPLLIYKNASVPKEIAENIQTMQNLNSDDIAEAIANNTLEVNDLNGNMAFLGV